MGVHEREGRRLIKAGADPRRAGPAAAAYFGLPRRFHAGQALAIGIVIGCLAVTATSAIVIGVFGLDPSRFGFVRSANETSALQSAKAQVEDALSSVPVAQQTAALADLVRLAPLLHDAVALRLLRAVAVLTADDKRSLAADAQVGSLLGQVAKLTRTQRDTLRGVLAQPERVNLFGPLLDLDPTTVALLQSWHLASDRQRQTLAMILSAVSGSDAVRFDRLIAAYSSRAPSLIALLDSRLLDCSNASTRACR